MGRALDMILTGRAVQATEALAFGLINQMVARGTALSGAMLLAQQIAAVPQLCLRTDRNSAYVQWDMSLAEALRNEGKYGAPVVLAEGLSGARQFAHGSGRHGNFNETK